MSAETRKVLEMLADKKITTEEADKLLEKLSGQPVGDLKFAEEKTDERSSSSKSKPRFLRIQVDKPGHDQVNVRVPLSFARTAPLLFAVLPTRVREKLDEQGINLSETGAIDPKDWQKAIESMNIDVEKGDGKRIRVFCE